MKIIPSVPAHALNLCLVAACGAAERIEFDSNRWISRCELTVCYHRWMQWWRNDAGNNLLALQKSYGLYFAQIKGRGGEERRSRFICVIKILEHIFNVYRSYWAGAKQFYWNDKVFVENGSLISFKSHFSRLRSTCSTNCVVMSDAELVRLQQPKW